MEKLLVITSYPERGVTHSEKAVGVASYTKLLLEGLVKTNPYWKVNVIAERMPGKSSYSESEVNIERVWRRNDFMSLVKLYSMVYKSDAKKVLLSFEISLFGNLFYSFLGIVGLLVARLFGKKTYILLHHVALDFGGLEKGIKARILNVVAECFYFLVKLSASEIYVFEGILKNRLGGERVKVLPHLVSDVTLINKNKARQKLGLSRNKKLGLYFGYIAPYKGADWLVENWPVDENIDLVLAGGINPNHKKNANIVNFVSEVKQKASKKGIKLTGFVSEKEIKYYYSACDFVVLPYKMFFSSSGPLALAFAYNRPVLLSSVLKDYTQTKDFRQAIADSGLDQNDIIFSFNQKSLTKSIWNVSKKSTKFKKFASEMVKLRSVENISKLLSLYLEQSTYFQRNSSVLLPKREIL